MLLRSLLFTCSPIDGESLSSYRQRLWQCNAHDIYLLASGENRRNDPDATFKLDILQDIASQSGLSIDDVAKLSLWEHPLLVAQHRNANPAWLVPLDYGSSESYSASAYCPVCLVDGQTPHFKKIWRLSPTVACPIHHCLLEQRCHLCGFTTWPRTAVSFSKLYSWRVPMDFCPHCRNRLGGTSGRLQASSLAIECSEAMSERRLISGLGPASTTFAEQFLALRGLMIVLLSTRCRERIFANEVTASAIKPFADHLNGQLRFDRLPMTLRRVMIEIALPILCNWPRGLVDFCSRARISMSDFSAQARYIPEWMNEAIKDELGQPGRLVTPLAVDDAIAQLTERGRALNITNVAMILRSKDAAPIKDRFMRRRQATSAELKFLIDRLAEYIGAAAGSRQTSCQIRARNVLVVLLQLVTEETVDSIMNYRQHEVLSLLGRHRVAAITALSSDIVAVSYFHAARLFEGRRFGADGSFFFGFRSGMSVSRGVRAALVSGMSGLDPRLQRRVEVFWGLLD